MKKYEVLILSGQHDAKWSKVAGSWRIDVARSEADFHRNMGFRAMVVPQGTYAENKLYARRLA